MIALFLKLGALVSKFGIWVLLMAVVTWGGIKGCAWVEKEREEIASIQRAMSVVADARIDTAILQSGETTLANIHEKQKVVASQAVAQVRREGRTAIDRRTEANRAALAKLDENEKRLKSDTQSIGKWELMQVAVSPAALEKIIGDRIRSVVRKWQIDAERAYLQEETAYLTKISEELAKAERDVAQTSVMCGRFQKTRVAFNELHSQVERFTAEERQRARQPGTNEYKTKIERDSMVGPFIAANENYRSCVRNLSVAEQRAQYPKWFQGFAPDPNRIRRSREKASADARAVQEEVSQKLASLTVDGNRALAGSWLKKVQDNVAAELKGPDARAALHQVFRGVVVLFTLWISSKLGMYFLLAPRASKAPPIQLWPASKGRVRLVPRAPSAGGAPSPVALSISLDQATELLVVPEFLKGTDDGCIARTVPVLDLRALSASLTLGMYNLTAVAADKPLSAHVAVDGNPMSELAIVEIGEESAAVFRLGSVAGVIRRRDMPVTLSRKWSLWRLQSWLTLRFRYVAIHGPVRVIAIAGRGVTSFEPTVGRSIEKGAAIAFSANLLHSTIRSETFVAYLTGRRSLMSDRFVGGPGEVVFDQVNVPSVKGRRARGRGGDIGGVVTDAVGAATGVN